MATLKNININRNFSVRQDNEDNVSEPNMIYKNVKFDECYDLVQFSIVELNKPYYWAKAFGFKLNTNESKIRKVVKEYCNNITDTMIKEYKKFLEDGEKYEWD